MQLCAGPALRDEAVAMPGVVVGVSVRAATPVSCPGRVLAGVRGGARTKAHGEVSETCGIHCTSGLSQDPLLGKQLIRFFSKYLAIHFSPEAQSRFRNDADECVCGCAREKR